MRARPGERTGPSAAPRREAANDHPRRRNRAVAPLREAAYDPLGNVCRYVDPFGQVTEMTYGGTGVLLKLVEPTGQFRTFEYDENERLRRIENSKSERYEYLYDWAGRVVEERPFDGRTLRYEYDKSERLTGSLRNILTERWADPRNSSSFTASVHLKRVVRLRRDSSARPVLSAARC